MSEAPSEQPLVRLSGISKSFAGVHALRDVDLEIRRGEIVCLAGENGSGKSTLIKILAGAQDADAGTIAIDGREHRALHPIEAVRAGIQVIYQDFSLFPNLTVAENIAFNHQLSHGRRLVNWRLVRRIAREALERIGVRIDLDRRVETLPVADKQLVAIARALLHDARLIVMDEPTTALTEREVRSLLDIIRKLQRDGVAVLFVSHKLKEIFAVCEKIVVLRNGRKVAAGPASEFDLGSLTFHMTGRTLEAVDLPPPAGPGAPELLRVEGLGRGREFDGVSFCLRAGEVLGITGLLGSGRTELAKALFGLAPADRGRILVEGREAAIRSVRDAMEQGIGYVPEDRLTEGLFLPQSIGRNAAVGILDRFAGRGGALDRPALEGHVEDWVRRLKVATPSTALPVQSLSGGNQQRVVLARWLATRPRILILNGPTVGVDVGSKADIHAIIAGLARDGLGVVVISDDLPEVLAACHRILVMRDGRIVEEVARDEASEDQLAHRLAS
ncbi:sugar ABC transporter ATP-binding protein [Arenibaculum pallidiluteum]|uniref:sugar ABC transporter ATP-binding protein n=1 Tax=Arenibaculum pallidiluteum TaxID=2812559 RepID=UPI001A97649A|nr:sugar ABC transporter ATP-binding protein [Arenibaculum pallidiluteum]